LNLSRYFAAICGPDTFVIQKPDPQMLQLAARDLEDIPPYLDRRAGRAAVANSR